MTHRNTKYIHKYTATTIVQQIPFLQKFILDPAVKMLRYDMKPAQYDVELKKVPTLEK